MEALNEVFSKLLILILMYFYIYSISNEVNNFVIFLNFNVFKKNEISKENGFTWSLRVHFS